jgi:hypothetical protein
LVSIPSAEGTVLDGVLAVSRSNVWVVGTQNEARVLEHWNGRRWQIVSDPVRGETVTETVRWNGRPWSVISRGNGTALSGSSQRDVWSVSNGDVVAHWDGKHWTNSRVSAPGQSQTYLSDVAAIAPKNVWIVGAEEEGISLNAGLIHHWDGKRWKVAYVGVGAELNGIAAISARDVWPWARKAQLRSKK